MTTATPRIPQSPAVKGLVALAHCVQHPKDTVRSLQRGLAQVYRDRVAGHSPIPLVPLPDLLDAEVSVTLSDCVPRNGNVSMLELLAITALVRRRQPRVVWEIGTFDGNTTLQIALNAPADATVVTLLPDSNKKYLSTDLCAVEEPQDHYLSQDVELIGFDVIPPRPLRA